MPDEIDLTPHDDRPADAEPAAGESPYTDPVSGHEIPPADFPPLEEPEPFLTEDEMRPRVEMATHLANLVLPTTDEAPELWTMEPSELDAIVPPLTAVLNRRAPQLRHAVSNMDEAVLAFSVGRYALRRVAYLRGAGEELPVDEQLDERAPDFGLDIDDDDAAEPWPGAGAE